MANIEKAKQIKKYSKEILGVHVPLAECKRMSMASREELLEFYMEYVEDILPRLRREIANLTETINNFKK